MKSNDLVDQIMAQVIAKVSEHAPASSTQPSYKQRDTAMAEKACSLTEFVGTAIGDTVGLVIANVDSALLDAMKLEKTLSLDRYFGRSHRRGATHHGGG